MSFKLQDNQSSSHVRLKQKSRVNDILEEAIPSTEYLVNRSGKYCCKVCPHWPVFDTLVMLIRHRESSKHNTHFGKWNKAMTLKALDEEHKFSVASGNDFDKASAGIAGSIQTEFISSTRTRNDPMNCTCRDEPKRKKSKFTPFFQPNYSHKSDCPCVKFQESMLYRKIEKASLPRAEVENGYKSSEIRENTVSPINSEKNRIQQRSRKENSSLPLTKNDIDNKKVMEYYVQMKKDGWVMDRDGKWVRDENCEFDSDDEPPSFSEFESCKD